MQTGTRPTVMVVDDYDDVRSILTRWLEEHACQVIEATGGREAVAMAQRERPDLILMDLALPEIDGLLLPSGSARMSSCVMFQCRNLRVW